MSSVQALEVTDVQAILDAIPSPVFVLDRRHRIVLCNTGCESSLACSRDALIGSTMDAFVLPEEAEAMHAGDDRVFETGEDDESEEQVTDASGHTRTIITRKRRIRLGEDMFVIGVVTDVTERRAAEAHNRYLALHDLMTGLPNRTLLNERLEQALVRARRGPYSCALLYVDLDRFKEVNDSLGHAAGDELLCAFASRLAGAARGCDTIARLGGDEFALLLNDIGERFDTNDLSRRILRAAAEPFSLGGTDVYVGASIGVALLETDLEFDEFHRRADVALYDAKHSGRGCFRVYSTAMDERSQRVRRLERDLRRALGTGEGLAVHYQPVVSFEGEVTGLEALARWHHPELGMVAPQEFIPIAEQTGLILALGEWVLDEATRVTAPYPALTIAVNLSPVQLAEPAIVERILAITDANGLQRHQLLLEITESTVLTASPQDAAKLHCLREAGVRMVLDDFGVGYSSLAHLQNLDIDRVKMDRSVVSGIDASASSRAIAQVVIGVGHTLGLAVTAGGVETEFQREILRALGCSDFQGYLFSSPLPELGIRAYLSSMEASTRGVAASTANLRRAGRA